MNNKVFVYGSLKTGFGNNHILQVKGSSFVADDVINGFDMYAMGGFPGIVVNPSAGKGISGEVWKVDDEVLQRLNSLEGFRGQDDPSNFYNRVEVETVNGHKCLVYIQETIPSNHPVPSGEWCKSTQSYRY